MTEVPASLARASIAFVSMEIALEAGMNCYSGGLGVLAGDLARAAADLDLPMAFVTLASRDGYVRQEIDSEGMQRDKPDGWDPARWARPLDPIIEVAIEGRPVAVRAWLYELEGAGGAAVGILLLDTDLPQNSPEQRALTGRLYGGDARYRLCQEAVLGIGTPRILQAIGLSIARYHLNEGHAALLPLELVAAGTAVEQVRDAVVFTTHTPIAAGRDHFDFGLAESVLGPASRALVTRLMPEAADLDMTLLALRLSGYANAVSERHAETARDLYPGDPIQAITNGVHLGRWAAPPVAALFDAVAPAWRTDSARLAAIADIDPERLARAREEGRHRLIAEVETRAGARFDAERPTLCFARRMTAYKRPELLFQDLDRLTAIAARRPFNVVVAGKAHPADAEGKEAIAHVHAIAERCRGLLSVAYLPGHDLDLAQILVAGADIWLNVPVPPLEASGTSGMKAAVNGGLNLSTPDGWWLEGYRAGVNGWMVGAQGTDPAEHGRMLLDMLEEQVLPIWYDDQELWRRMMCAAVATIAPQFSASRALRDYARTAYRLDGL